MMANDTPLYNLAPVIQVVAMGALIAGAILAFWWLKHRATDPKQRVFRLTALVLFLTFDLVVFGAFTRLTDSGLGCPDWPGCYGHASPVGANVHIEQAQQAMPTGPVTHQKAWIEMIHRYLATAVGLFLVVLCVHAWRRLPGQRLWPTVTLIWVMVQGAFGALTVTLKLMPLIVTLHLLGGLLLLALLTIQVYAPAPPLLQPPRARSLKPWVVLMLVLIALQIALGGWVSTNYAVLACYEFPTCRNGLWWPEMNFQAGFELLRPLGRSADGETLLPLSALTAIHLVHRLGALVVTAGALALMAKLKQYGLVRWSWAVALLLLVQILTGISNVIFQWPLTAALLHTAGAAMWVIVLTALAVRLRDNSSSNPLVANREF
jgi:cytochrome c oxidase assembly protein subunit 15